MLAFIIVIVMFIFGWILGFVGFATDKERMMLCGFGLALLMVVLAVPLTLWYAASA